MSYGKIYFLVWFFLESSAAPDTSETFESYLKIYKEKLRCERDISFKYYNSVKDINKFLDKLAKEYSHLVKVETIGKSHNSQPIKAITIDNGIPYKRKRTTLIDAGIHAREWITTTTALFVIRELIKNYDENREFLARNTIIVVPMVNTDGYDYSQIFDKNWRKTRRANSDARCPGTDINRNFDVHWDIHEKQPSECSDTYRGPYPFSEPEAAALKDFLQKTNPSFYFSLHSFSRKFILPWAYTNQRPQTYHKMESIAMTAHKAIMKLDHRRVYQINNPYRFFQKIFGGSSMDYAHEKLGIPITITVELPPSGDSPTFHPSKKHIIEYALEGWIVLKAMIERSHDFMFD